MRLKPKGKYGFRRTLEYLNGGTTYLKENVKTISVHYRTNSRGHEGLQRFWHEKVPQIQYKNPKVQIFSQKNEDPIPLVKVYFGNGTRTKLDVEGKPCDKILDELEGIAGKTGEQVSGDQKLSLLTNPANFGLIGRKCICEIPGQVPCPAKVPLPKAVHAFHEKEEKS
ncbi:small ribosomal subunit protein mS25-like [Oscarella lobularis]|uniref:small ribosomal subunit protein mS25-like n=1 Tax=Oscarella lobularis TaxID=121494 RepID=UPI0033133CCE